MDDLRASLDGFYLVHQIWRKRSKIAVCYVHFRAPFQSNEFSGVEKAGALDLYCFLCGAHRPFVAFGAEKQNDVVFSD